MTEKKGPDAITLTYDLLKWALQVLKKYPKDQRYLLGDRIEAAILDVLELLIRANYSRKKLECLREANLKLEMPRFLWRISEEMKYISTRQYEFVSKQINETGKLVGGWIRHAKGKDEAAQ